MSDIDSAVKNITALKNVQLLPWDTIFGIVVFFFFFNFNKPINVYICRFTWKKRFYILNLEFNFIHHLNKVQFKKILFSCKS